MRHTPGPWRAGPNPAGEFSNEIVVRPVGDFPHGRWIADCGALDDPERIANARLIACAPDMLAALKLGQVMRDRQRAYFKERSQGALIVSKQAEAEFDRAALAAITRAEGSA